MQNTSFWIRIHTSVVHLLFVHADVGKGKENKTEATLNKQPRNTQAQTGCFARRRVSARGLLLGSGFGAQGSGGVFVVWP